jgi:CRP/FNR family cyclic AMP-dependent transcriptional regulator
MVSAEQLRRFQGFSEVPETTLAAVSRVGELKCYSAGQLLFEEGTAPEFLCYVVNGHVDIQAPGPGGEMVTVDSVGDGQLLLWSAVVEPYQTTARGVARSETLVVALRAGELRKICEREHTLGYRLLQDVTRSLGARLGGAFRQLAGCNAKTTERTVYSEPGGPV